MTKMQVRENSDDVDRFKKKAEAHSLIRLS